jgi:hypothetical protein
MFDVITPIASVLRVVPPDTKRPLQATTHTKVPCTERNTQGPASSFYLHVQGLALAPQPQVPHDTPINPMPRA